MVIQSDMFHTAGWFHSIRREVDYKAPVLAFPQLTSRLDQMTSSFLLVPAQLGSFKWRSAALVRLKLNLPLQAIG